ncbi:hypothetical protein SacmaDRAFT_0600 [Saccharomonospora marina XMU15]|uniref:O-antigen ligase domain-containing protein n=1 Tax=Saccharomonospora marina XMU15 TaxID=882083 RepID=H5X590_9PSEU|nr:membrane protein [Saccharomonospora marina]EHR48901.1 hypothetical protein SacmaDRAFT_0600 [Saccharomonospora marina XMU15]
MSLPQLSSPSAAVPEQQAPPYLGAVWALLIVNTLGSAGAETLIPIPRLVIQVVTMGALVAAFALALLLNPRVRLRPSVFLLSLSLLVVLSVVSSVDLGSGVGALLRCVRFAVFVATLWLLTPWWDSTLTFVRHHIRAAAAVLLSVLLGLLVAPGLALPDYYGGRLVGALWPLTAPQVGQYAAVVIGLTMVLWLGRRCDWRSAVVLLLPAVAALLLSHTRTATLGLVAGLAVAVLSLTFTSARARRMFGWAMLVVGLVTVAAGPAVQAWFLRGQSEEDLANLTGRAKVWDALLALPRSTGERLLGVGLTDKSFDGLPIDSAWLAVYHEQGFVGVAIVCVLLAALVVAAALRPPSIERACAMFLIGYCLVASYTEAGLGDASTYLLHLAVAASLLTSGRQAA